MCIIFTTCMQGSMHAKGTLFLWCSQVLRVPRKSQDTAIHVRCKTSHFLIFVNWAILGSFFFASVCGGDEDDPVHDFLPVSCC